MYINRKYILKEYMEEDWKKINNIWNTTCKGCWEMLFIKEFWKGYGISIKEPTHDLSTVDSFIYSISYIYPFPIFKLPDKNNNKNRQV